MPSGPHRTFSDTAGDGRQVMTASLAAATAFGESAQRAPRANKGAASSLFRSVTVSAKPFAQQAARELGAEMAEADISVAHGLATSWGVRLMGPVRG